MPHATSLSPADSNIQAEAPPQRLDSSNFNSYLLQLCGGILLVVTYLINYSNFVLVPGNNPTNPLGWWLWDDQREYLRAAQAFLHSDFRASEHFYPPLYSSIGSLFLTLAPSHPFFIPDLIFTLAYFFVFVALFNRYVGVWAATVCALAGMVLYRPFRLQWVIPWTTTPGAFLSISALFLLDRYVRRRNENWWDSRASALNAAGFGLVVGLQAPNRPVDLVVLAPVAIAYATLVLVSTFRAPERKNLIAIASGLVAFVIPLIFYFGFNKISYGTLFGRYFAINEKIGFDPIVVPQQLFSHLLDSSTFFAERNADWLSVVPLALVAVAFLPLTLLAGPLVMRVIAACTLIQFAIYYSDHDILPTGTFRFCNIHYFKWLVPIAICVAFYFLRQAASSVSEARRKACVVLACGIVFELAASCIVAVPQVETVSHVSHEGTEIALDLSGEKINYIDLKGVSGRWGDIYFAPRTNVILDGRFQLSAVRDYRFLPTPSGVRVLFMGAIAARTVMIHLAEGMTVPEGFADADARAVRVRFSFGLPLSQD